LAFGSDVDVNSFTLRTLKPMEPVDLHRPKILVVESHLLIAESIASLLNLEGFQVDVAVPTAKGDFEEFFHSTWNVVILDIDFKNQDEVSRLVPLFSRAGPVVVLTAESDRLTRAWCLEAGAVALADKEASFRILIDIVARILGGESVISSGEREQLLEVSRRHAHEMQRRRAPFLELTTREAAVLTHLLDGQSVRAIARLSAVSESTVRSQIRSIFQKLGVNSQLRAVSLARQVGWSTDLSG
jgi:two-component system, NarL family, nitrate/nitrite response regulator NarL